MRKPWLYHCDVFEKQFQSRSVFEGQQVLARPAFYLYHITSLRIDPVKQLELLDLISQTDAVTLCWQIKVQINLPCVKRKSAEGGREAENGRP